MQLDLGHLLPGLGQLPFQLPLFRPGQLLLLEAGLHLPQLCLQSGLRMYCSCLFLLCCPQGSLCMFQALVCLGGLLFLGSHLPLQLLQQGVEASGLVYGLLGCVFSHLLLDHGLLLLVLQPGSLFCHLMLLQGSFFSCSFCHS